jgi:ABC-2 type transport system permease protein
MSDIIAQCYHLAIRDLRNFVRQPSYLVVSLIQPMIWLLLFGQLLAPLMRRSGTTDSYISLLTPGIVALTALYASGWSGIVFVNEMQQGTLNRFLVTPARHGALMAGRLVRQIIVVLIQSVVVMLIGLVLGARFSGGILIMLAFLVCVVFSTIAFASLSNALGLVTRRQESVVAIAQLLVLPLAFLSVIFVPRPEMPGWMSALARVNPVNWLVEVGQQTMRGDVDWGQVLGWSGGLLLVALVCSWLSTLAFRFYQRQV